MIDFSRPTAHPRAHVFKRAALIALVLYSLLLVYFSLVPIEPSGGEYTDKILHFIAYGGLTGLFAAALPHASLRSIFIGVSLMGATIELAQGVLSLGRMASFADQLANMSGALLALFIWLILVLLRDQIRRQRDKNKPRQ